MSPLAGPVSAAAVVLDKGWRAAKINDSKQVDPETREELAGVIRREARAWAVAFVEPEEIDRLNIYWAGLLAMQRAVEGLKLLPQHLLIDARRLRDVSIEQTKIIKGDERSLSIAAASILAKTARDARMVENLRDRGVIKRPADLGIDARDATRNLLAARSMRDLVRASGGLYSPPKRFRNW